MSRGLGEGEWVGADVFGVVVDGELLVFDGEAGGDVFVGSTPAVSGISGPRW